MKISELIQILEELKNKHGDLNVCVDDSEYGGTYDIFKEDIEVTDHPEDGYIVTIMV